MGEVLKVRKFHFVPLHRLLFSSFSGWQLATSLVARWQSRHREKVTDPSAEIKPQSWGRVMGQRYPRLGQMDKGNWPTHQINFNEGQTHSTKTGYWTTCLKLIGALIYVIDVVMNHRARVCVSISILDHYIIGWTFQHGPWHWHVPSAAKRQSWLWPFSDFPATTFCKSSKSFWFASSRTARTCAFCKNSIKVSYSQLIDINWPISYSQLIQLFTVVKTIWVNVVRHRSASKVGLLSTQNISCSNPSVSRAHLTRWNPHVLHVSLFVANKGNKKSFIFSDKYQTHLHFFPINSPAFFKQSRLLSKLNPFGAAQLPALSWSWCSRPSRSTLPRSSRQESLSSLAGPMPSQWNIWVKDFDLYPERIFLARLLIS